MKDVVLLAVSVYLLKQDMVRLYTRSTHGARGVGKNAADTSWTRTPQEVLPEKANWVTQLERLP
jgi:hypothetical protein